MKSPDSSLSFPENKSTSDKTKRSGTGANTVRLVRKCLRVRNNIKKGTRMLLPYKHYHSTLGLDQRVRRAIVIDVLHIEVAGKLYNNA